MSWLRHGLVIGAIFTALSAHVLADQNFMEVKPSPQQVAWQDLEFGVIIHFSTNTFLDRNGATARQPRSVQSYAIRSGSMDAGHQG